MTTNYKPNYSVHPSEDIIDFAKYHKLSQKQLAEKSGLTEQVIDNVMSGKCDIDNEISEGLAKAFSIKPLFFLNLQKFHNENVDKVVIG